MAGIDIKYQTCNLCDAMHRNINDKFKSISFEILNDGNVQVKIILEKRTKIEDEYIDDIIAEFSALQLSDCVLQPIIVAENNNIPLKNIVYLKDYQTSCFDST